MKHITTLTIGDAWLKALKLVFKEGMKMHDGDESILEVPHVILEIIKPDEKDNIIYRYGEQKQIDWMLRNFFEEKEVKELGNTKSYNMRLFNYQNKGINQISQIVDKLKRKPESKSATITTFMPIVDTNYIPCVSLLDYWIRDDYLENVVYARSLDFGKKAYCNLIALAKVHNKIANELQAPIGKMIIYVKSAHIYVSDKEIIRNILMDSKI